MTMKNLTVDIPRRWGSYQQHVVEAGHLPGVLSGAELCGQAARWGAGYHQSRIAVEDFLRRRYGVESALVLGASRRWVRVWVRDGEPVQLSIEVDGE